MQLGAYFAGMAIENSMLGATHACANPLTTHYGTAHGASIAILLPSVVRWNASVAGNATPNCSNYHDLDLDLYIYISSTSPNSENPGGDPAESMAQISARRCGRTAPSLGESGVPRPIFRGWQKRQRSNGPDASIREHLTPPERWRFMGWRTKTVSSEQ